MLRMSYLYIIGFFVLSTALFGEKEATGTEAQEIARLKALKTKLSLENAIANERLRKVLQELRFQQEKLALENKLQETRQQKDRTRLQREMQKTQLELLRLKKSIAALGFKTSQQGSRLTQIKSDLALRSSRRKASKMVLRDIPPSRYPYKDGILTISERRIGLNGPIIRGVADYVTRRIHFFNNQSSAYPIFLVIDICPGGSVMEGYRILKAMEASRAPVYVVVKSFAASMAAVITTLAKRSFAYPNAVILHHQMSTVNWGNMTEIKEQLRIAQEWEQRLHRPVAKKMGIGVKAFVQKMYANNSRGDWEEFADRAVKLKWVDHIVKGVEEQSILDKPGDKKPARRLYRAEALKRDASGSRYVELPRLSPFDFYFIYNPDRFYR